MAAFDTRMHGFRPTRASPPARRTRILHQSPSDLSIRSEQQLRDLSPEEIDFLDAVFERAGPKAVGFMPVFEAYNVVLAERGLAQDEVVGYAKLLKVGNWRGETWQEKWKEVKRRFEYNASDSGRPGPSRNPSVNSARKFLKGAGTKRAPPKPRTYQESEVDETDNANPQYHNTPNFPRRVQSPCPSENTIDVRDANLRFPASVSNRYLRPISAIRSEATSASEDNGTPSTTPPSYKTTEKEVVPTSTRRNRPVQSSQRISLNPKAPIDASAARKVLAAARERKGCVVNENEAWKKIQMERDEKEAQLFYQDKLLERCWEMWKNGYKWVIVTGKQIDGARDNLLLRITLQRWRNELASRQLLRERAVMIMGRKRLKRFFDLWIDKLKRRRQERWRQDMRMRMKIVRDKREARIERDAWAKWRHLYRLYLAAHNRDRCLTRAFFDRWRQRLEHIDRLDILADETAQRGLKRLVVQKWAWWKHVLELSLSEKVFVERNSRKKMKNIMAMWRKQTRDLQAAQTFYNFKLVKSSLNSWKAARDRLHHMDDRANRQIARQDDLLLRAVLRIWRARERGLLLERVINMRYLRDTLLIWQKRLQDQRQNEDQALQFSARPRSSALTATFKTWQRNFITRQNAYAYAMQYHSTQVLDRMLLAWRLALRRRLKIAKSARKAHNTLALRRAWCVWRLQLEQSRREALLKTFEARRLKNIFSVWMQRAEQARTRRISGQVVGEMVAKRTVRDALRRWTTAVINVKLRELEVAQQYDLSAQMIAFNKWKNACIRHAEELSLMESYRYVKREECLRKFLHRWLSAARTVRRRRITLKEREEEMNTMFLMHAWDKWREHFVKEKLRVMERNVSLQNRRNLLFRTFGVWHSKTKSLPALRFHAMNLKAKYFEIWCSALPSALQAKKAREAHQRVVLSRCMGKWTESYRAKMSIKAVARARYLRLPTAVPRPLSSGTHTAQAAALTRRHNQTDSPEHESTPSISALLSKPNSYKESIADLLRAKRRNATSPARSSISARHPREVSPARTTISVPARSGRNRPSSPTASSTGGKEENRGKLWLELRDIQRKKKPFWP